MFKYKVLYWNNYECKETYDTGIVAAENYATAADKIDKAFGNDLIDMYLTRIDIDDCKDIVSWEDIKLSFQDE